MNWSDIVKQTPVTNTDDRNPIKKVKSQPCQTEIVDYETLFNLYYNATIEDLFLNLKMISIYYLFLMLRIHLYTQSFIN